MRLLNKRGRHYKKPALWKRTIKWTAISLAAVVITVGLAGFIFVYHTLGKIGQNTEVVYRAKQQLDVPPPDQPMNILLLGADVDPAGTSRSDTIMLVRIDPKSNSVSVLSIPRDTIVPIPGYAPNKINAAYAFGGVPLAIETVKKLTGLPIHHFVLINYQGFKQAVDALGGVYVDVDRRYFNDNSNAPSGEAYEPINLQPGYQKLNGSDALSFVRFRHTDSDFIRIDRQQYFLRDAKAQAMKWSNITKLPELVDVLASNTTSDIGRSDVLSLTKFLLSVDKNHILQAQIPITMAADGTVNLDKQALPGAIDSFSNPTFNNPQPAVPGGAPAPQVPSDATKQLVIEIRNGNGVDGDATKLSSLLAQKGCSKVNVTGDAKNTYDDNQVFYANGKKAAADEMCSLLQPCQEQPLTPDIGSSADLLIVVGKAFSGQLGGSPPPAAAPEALSFANNTGSVSADWHQAAQKLSFPLTEPTSFPTSYQYGDFRTYKIDTDDGPKPALRVVCQDQAGNSWGITETTFTDAPLLENPTVKKEIGGKSYRFYYAGSDLRYLAWQDGDVVCWLSNSLENSLSEDTMVKIATSFKPV